MSKKAPGRPFKKGHAGGPGRPPVPVEIREARALNVAELQRLLNEMINHTPEQLMATLHNKKKPMIEVMVASILIKGANQGDQMRLNFVLERLVGKVSEKLEVSNPHMSKSLEELERLVKEKLGE